MRLYKRVTDGFIMSIGQGNGGEEITFEEYNAIMNAIANKPQATETTDYKLKDDLTWEAYIIEPVEEDTTAEELLNVLLGEDE